MNDFEINIKLLLMYEMADNWFVLNISWGPLQDLFAKYYAKKVTRKYARYKRLISQGLIATNQLKEFLSTNTQNKTK